MSAFVRWKWTKKKREAAEMLAEGYSTNEAALSVGVDARSIRRWKADTTFSDEVDRLTMGIGIATTAERLRVIKRAVRQAVTDDAVRTKKDVLDWLKLAHDETNKQAGNVVVNIGNFDTALVNVYGGSDSTRELPDNS